MRIACSVILFFLQQSLDVWFNQKHKISACTGGRVIDMVRYHQAEQKIIIKYEKNNSLIRTR